MNYCAIDFGTSNSAVAVPDGATLRLAPVEGAYTTLPTSVFFNTDENTREFGRAALAAYIDGFDGRLMRSMKSILGSPLAENSTHPGDCSGAPPCSRFSSTIAGVGPRQAPAGRSVAPCSVVRCFSSTTTHVPTSSRN